MYIIGFAVITLFAFIILGQLKMYFGSQKMKGKPVPDDVGELDDFLRQNLDQNTLLYFYSPKCGPCKTMTPLVDTLIQEGKPARKININKEPQLALKFGIRATPTTFILRSSIIEKVFLGARSYQFMDDLLIR